MDRNRRIARVYPAVTQSEGAGAMVHRTIGNRALESLDPFLLLDEFELKKEANSPGFPDHPHRGFETVTYMFNGIMTHEDSHGGGGTIYPGEVQWMTAGKGLVHSETPDYSQGDVHGIQLWVNLPAKDKMRKPRYQDVTHDKIQSTWLCSAHVKVIAGEVNGVEGAINGITIDPLYLDVSFPEKGGATLPIGRDKTAFIYMVSGTITIKGQTVGPRKMAVLAEGKDVDIKAEAGTRFMVIAADPIKEPIARYGPFVMNTQAEIHKAINDYNAGNMG